MFHIIRANYERGVPVERSFLRKTAKLVQEQTWSGEVGEPSAVYELNEQTLERIAVTNQPDTVKVFGLLKSLHDHVRRLAGEQPWLISIGDRAEAVALAFEERLKTTQETLADLVALLSEVREAEQERDKTDLSREAFAVLWHLKRRLGHGASDAAQLEQVARAVEVAFAEHPHWRSGGAQERELRKEFYKVLIDAGAEDVVDLAIGLLRMLRRASP